jgi:hypothetical protein
MIGLYIAVFVVVSTLLLACALFVLQWFETRSPNKNRKLPWERREGDPHWHFNSARRELYACGSFRPFYERPIDRAELPPEHASVCSFCLARASNEALAFLTKNLIDPNVDTKKHLKSYREKNS